MDPEQVPVVRRGGLPGALAFVFAAPLAAAGGLALAPLAGLAGLLSLRRPRAWPPVTVLFILGFAGWVAATAIWSPASNAAAAALKLLAGILTGLALVAACRDSKIVRAAGLACAIVLCALLLIEALFGMPLSYLAHPGEEAWVLARNPGRGCSFLILLLGPACVVAYRLRSAWLAVLLFAVGGFLATRFGMDANLAAFAVASAAALAAFFAPRFALTLLGGATALAILAAPLLARLLPAAGAPWLPYSWSDRLAIWRSAVMRIEQHPMLGHGLDASRTMEASIAIGGELYAPIQLHPHSAALQVWLEAGAVGAILLAVVILLATWLLARRVHGVEAAALAWSMAAFTGLGLVSFGAWQEWWIASGFLAAALLAASCTRQMAIGHFVFLGTDLHNRSHRLVLLAHYSGTAHKSDPRD